MHWISIRFYEMGDIWEDKYQYFLLVNNMYVLSISVHCTYIYLYKIPLPLPIPYTVLVREAAKKRSSLNGPAIKRRTFFAGSLRYIEIIQQIRLYDTLIQKHHKYNIIFHISHISLYIEYIFHCIKYKGIVVLNRFKYIFDYIFYKYLI